MAEVTNIKFGRNPFTGLPDKRIYSQAGDFLGSRPFAVNERTGQVYIQNESGVIVNSQLSAPEWRVLTQRVQQAALIRMNILADIKSRPNLVIDIPNFGTTIAEYSKASEAPRPNISMTGESVGNRQRAEFQLVGVPIPVVFEEFRIPSRTLQTSRMTNQPLDTTNATIVTRAVAEELERIVVLGATNVVYDGKTIYGLTNETNVNTDTATNYGGGDWGTIGNVIPTVTGMINAAKDDRHYGPFWMYVSGTQYNQSTTARFTDGSGQSPAQFVKEMDQIEMFKPSDLVADGGIVMFEPSEDVVDYVEHMSINIVEWVAPDGSARYYKVMAVSAPRVKSDFYNRSGIVYATGA